MKTLRERREFKGIPVSPGIIVGKAYLIDRRKVRPPERIIDPEMAESEVGRFHQALEESQQQLQELKSDYERQNLGDYGYLVDVHLLMLSDRMLVQETETLVREKLHAADWAVWQVIQKIKRSFEEIDDEYFRDRRSDVEHLGDRILGNLTGRKHESIADIKGDVVVVAHDLSPMDTAQMDVNRVKAFVTDLGGRTSHTAILARSLNIPAVAGLETVTDAVYGGDTIVVDGLSGTVILNPSSGEISFFADRRARYDAYRHELESYAALPAVTRDGHKVRVAANIELLAEISNLGRYGAEGIGLYRTEFLYMNRADTPSEDEHFETYRKVAEAVHPYSVTIRTLDAGGDKALASVRVGEESNPALGLRSIRLCLREKALFKAQLKGILRASATGNVRVMFPMVSGLGEFLEVKTLLDEAKEELRADGKDFNPEMPVGVMIEVPSAAVTAETLARHVDFFSIGTNDLIQYALAIDRVNEHVAYLYEPLHPAVLLLTRMVVEAGHRHGIPVAVCGEMAGDELYTIVLLGLGVDELSMHALSVPRIKRVISHASLADAQKLAGEILKFGTGPEVHARVEQYMNECYPGIMNPLEGGA